MLRIVLEYLAAEHDHLRSLRGDTAALSRRIRLLRKLEFHYVPKHASWLNMVEIEIGVLASQCLARRIPDLATLTTEVEAWTAARHHAGAVVKWMFGIEQARLKLGHAYPTHYDAARHVAA